MVAAMPGQPQKRERESGVGGGLRLQGSSYFLGG